MAVIVEEACIPQALQALNAGDGRLHDERVVDAAPPLHGCDVLVLGQFSMACAASAVQAALSTPVLTSPDSAMQEIRRLLRK